MNRSIFLFFANLPLSYEKRRKLFHHAGAKIGASHIRKGFFIDHPDRLSVGDESFINYYCHIHCGDAGHVVIGNNVFIGPEVKICCVSHEIGNGKRRAAQSTYNDIIIEDGVWIGIGSLILPGVQVGAGSIVAGGSVVIENVPPNTLVGGVPAQVIKKLDG